MKIIPLILSGAVLLAQAPFSGPQPGEPLPPFQALMVNGADAGREIDFVSRQGAAPMLVVFLHQIDRNVGALMQPLERFAQDRAAAGLRTLYVYLAADKVEGERRMQAVAKSLRLQSAVGVSVDGVEGPGAYGLNKQVAVTALVAREGKVTANFAIIQPGMVDAPRILGEAAKHVGGKVMTVAELEAERDRQRTEGERMRTGMAKPAAEPDPPELVSLLRSLIQRTNTPEQVDQVVGQIREWTSADAKRRTVVAKKMEVILPLKYGTEYAQSRMAVLKAEMEK
ncbi:MAG: hypothetical protein HYR60_18070 [Acidobacteria bacterium]|nr:hypothetical protein [Acidobacteriota bacterium]